MAPISQKRSTSPDSDDDVEVSTSKRIHVEAAPPTPPPEELLIAKVTEAQLFDDEPRQLLLRSVALALEYVGFAGASQEALESFCAQVDTYTTHLLSHVTSSMLNARRSRPTPLDFQYAFARFDLPLASIEPHLKPPITASKLNLQLESPPAEAINADSLSLLLGNELSGEPDKRNKQYVPKRFPSFPSRHTYKWTEKESARETDPRKIREEAAKAARQGEEALRRLVRVSKAGVEKDVKRAASKDPRSKERHDLWERAMKDLMAGKRHATLGNTDEEDDRSMIVNADKQYWRKGVVAKKKTPVLIDLGSQI